MTTNIENENLLNNEVEEEIIDEVENETAEEKAERLEKQNQSLYEQLKKAKGFERVNGEWVKQSKPVTQEKPIVTTQSSKNDISTSDFYALVDAKVPQDDIEEVKEYAQLKGISIAEALKSTVVKSILSDKAEKRNIAEATHTGNARRTTGQVSDEALVAAANNGNLPDSDEEIARLAQSRRTLKRGK